MVGTHAGRVNRPSPWPWLVPVAALVAGTLFASSVRASQGEDLRTDQAQLPDLIRAQNRTNETRAADLDDLQGQVDEATAGLAPGDLQTQKLERQANEISTAAGRTPVRGPALRVTLDDAKLAGGDHGHRSRHARVGRFAQGLRPRTRDSGRRHRQRLCRRHVGQAARREGASD